MNFKIKALAVLLGGIYFVIILHSIAIGRNYFIGEPMSKRWSKEYYYVNVEPKEGRYSFKEKLNNTVSGELISAETKRLVLNLSASELGITESTKGLKNFIWALCSLLSSMVLITPFALAVEIYKVTRKGITKSTISLLNFSGCLLAVYFLFDLTNILMESFILRSTVGLENFKIIQAFPQYFILMLAVILLVLAQVLKESRVMKEEQDLTI